MLPQSTSEAAGPFGLVLDRTSYYAESGVCICVRLCQSMRVNVRGEFIRANHQKADFKDNARNVIADKDQALER